MTGGLGWYSAQMFTQANPGTVWWHIYHNHMNEDSFMMSDFSAINATYHSKETLTAYVGMNEYLYLMEKYRVHHFYPLRQFYLFSVGKCDFEPRNERASLLYSIGSS